MDFDIGRVMDWFDENKDWLMIPAIVNAVVVLAGIILIIVTGGDVNFALKMIFVVLIIGAPFLGFFLGEYLDPVLEPLFSAITGK